ncbi:MAG: hypothetical protein J6K45_02355 [Clostridia bacterium]|nr:hypothetical protein [Clostridia bacterium]
MSEQVKEKILGVFGFLKQNKKIVKIAIVVVIAIIVLVILANVVFSAKPKKYEDKIKDLAKALSSESKMKDLIEDKVIDLRGAAAWLEADQDADDMNKEYKNMKKDADEVEEMEEALVKWAENNESSKISYTIKSIKEPKKSEKNSKIYTVSATLVPEYSSSYASDSEYSIKITFYKGKIVDVMYKDSKASLFESATKIK